MRRLVLIGAVMTSTSAWAVPGPDSVVVVANADVPQSVALAERYAAARSLPPSQVCALPLPTTDTIDHAAFEAAVMTPLLACLDAAGATDRIEAAVLVRGVPLRVTLAQGPPARVSLAAALSVWRSTLDDGTQASLRTVAAGRAANCGGSPCTAARWSTPFTTGVFRAGWTDTSGGVVWRPILVTMLHGRTYADAAKLIASATTAEALGGARGEFLLMEGADAARDALDGDYPAVLRELGDRGLDAQQVPFDRSLTGRTLAAFFVGTASIDDTIEGNTFLPGALVDNLTSFGAVPQNFEAMGQSQVSIARWVSGGVGGVHGTTDEPLANSFPSRRLIVDYVDGMTLAEAYLRNMPFVYWQNLVLGDPMLAPYAERPSVRIEGLVDTAPGSVRLQVSASDAAARGIASLVLYVDGRLHTETDGAPIDVCASLGGVGARHILAVAQVRGSGQTVDGYVPKGWTSATIDNIGGPADCSRVDAGGAPVPPAVDAGTLDAARAGGPGSTPADDGCSCATSGGGDLWLVALLGFGLLVARRRTKIC